MFLAQRTSPRLGVAYVIQGSPFDVLGVMDGNEVLNDEKGLIDDFRMISVLHDI